jgi:predicted nuclease of predicted toxin-antitoxin system
LADENVHPEVVAWLRSTGSDVVTAVERRLNGRSDFEILDEALTDSRTVLTHDRDFGQLAILEGRPCGSIVFLRPGHLSAEYAITALTHLGSLPDSSLPPPVIVVARVVDDRVVVRTRSIAPPG